MDQVRHPWSQTLSKQGAWSVRKKVPLVTSAMTVMSPRYSSWTLWNQKNQGVTRISQVKQTKKRQTNKQILQRQSPYHKGI